MRKRQSPLRPHDDSDERWLHHHRLSDLDVYRLLIVLAERTGRLSTRCWSTAAATALQASSTVLRRLAAALYRANIRD